MKSRFLSAAQCRRSEFKATSLKRYKSVLARLCIQNPQFGPSANLLSLIRKDDWLGLLKEADSIGRQSYTTSYETFVANQFASLIKKYPFPRVSGVDPLARAKAAFHDAEFSCSVINGHADARLGFFSSELSSVRHQMRGFISYVLGPTVDYDLVFRDCDFGPGASVGVGGNSTNRARKLASQWTCTPSALDFAYCVIAKHFQLSECLLQSENGMLCFDAQTLRKNYLEHVDVVRHNKISFVPKTTMVHRTIAVEPLLNGFLQKGTDQFMRHRLKRIGIDLSDQEPNCQMALMGSLDDSEEGFVTIDLKSASDSISRELVRSLLSPDWYFLLDSIRSKEYLLDGKIMSYHKFCSMGNGFCFPLETLLFVAACHAVGCGQPGLDYRVYGDDIIVRKKYAKKLIPLLWSMGFETNSDKTHISGPFRESCGRDWFNGVDVRPFVLDFALDDIQCYFKFLNLSRRNEFTRFFFGETRRLLISWIHPTLRLFRPLPGPADTGIDADCDEYLTSPNVHWNRKLQCYEWSELLNRSVPDKWGTLRHANIAFRMQVLLGSPSNEPFTVRRRTRTAVRVVSHG